MLHVLVLIVCLGIVAEVRSDERKMMSLLDDQMLCGTVTCPLDKTAMCFTSSRLTKDANNASYITSCGTCLSIDGTTVRENCNTEPTKLTNYTNSMSISLLNSTVDQTTFRNGITGLLLSGMSNGSVPPPRTNGSFGPPSGYPSGYPSAFVPQAPFPPPQPQVVVVQQPPQQIYINQPSGPSGYGSDSGFNYDTTNPIRPERSPSADLCSPPNSPECQRSTQTFQPNGLPPQLDKIFNDIRSMHQTLNRVQATVQDLAAGEPIGYLNTPSDGKLHFPVYTPPAFG